MFRFCWFEAVQILQVHEFKEIDVLCVIVVVVNMVQVNGFIEHFWYDRKVGDVAFV